MGRYLIEGMLGAGGMGKVFRAYDPTLKRPVALKLLGEDDPGMRARLLQEASAQARVAHEHVCKVYEAGTAETGAGGLRAYIVMQYIGGETLAFVMGKMTLEQKTRVMWQIAEGVHAAHKTGLIHRDLKPSNVMMELTEDGIWKPYVLDFGLARESDAPQRTVTGSVLGTPAYMAPEQARGELTKLDRRTDVYSLGATYYELLAGRPPFVADSSLEILMKTIGEDPPPLRRIDPAIPADLDTIVMKCLQKEPQQRYDSAKALADDLHRFIDGEPILGRPTSWSYRILRKTRKHKVAVTTAVVAALAVVVVGAMGLHARWKSAEQVRIAQTFGQEVERVQSILEKSCLLPLHDTRPERERVRARMRVIKNRMAVLGGVAAGPGHYALGRGYLALDESNPALAELEQSWDLYEYREPAAAYALGLAFATRYREELSAAQRISSKEERQERLEEIARQYQQPARRYLQRGREAEGEAAEYVEALLAYLAKDYGGALRKIGEARRHIPWLYALDKLEADIYREMGNNRREEGKLPEATAFYHRAEAAYRRAIDKGRSDATNYEGLCALGTSYMYLILYQTSQSPEPWYEVAVTAADSALQANPDSGVACDLKAHAAAGWAEYQMYSNQDPRAALATAADSADRAIRLDSHNAAAWMIAGLIQWDYAYYEMGKGRDPRPALAKSIGFYRRSLAIDARQFSAYGNLCGTLTQMGAYQSSHGQDPTGSLEEAIRSIQRAIEIDPRSPYTYNNLGDACLELGRYQAKSGHDPEAAWERAIQSYRKALGFDPGMAFTHAGLAAVAADRGAYRFGMGREADPDFRTATACGEEAIRLNPNYSTFHGILGKAYWTQAQAEFLQGRSPIPLLERAQARINQALRLNPGENLTWETAGAIALLRARWEARSHRSPRAFLNGPAPAWSTPCGSSPRAPPRRPGWPG